MPAPNDLALLATTAVEAGRIALSHWRRDPATRTKSDGTPVSEADLAVDAFLHDTLTAARPDHGWRSEERAPTRLDAPRLFVADPIDGTRAYLEGNRTWAVSIALVEHGRPVAGVVHLPARELTFAAAQGRGATLNGAPLRASDRADPDGAHILVNRPALKPIHWRRVPLIAPAYRPSLAYRLCKVAEGSADAMLTFIDAWDWDIAAGALIAAEAGARVTDRHDRAPRLGTPAAQTPGLLVANPSLHAALHAQMA